MPPKLRSHTPYELSSIEKGYIAGFLDGEGSICASITPTRYPRIRVSAGQKIADPLLWLQSKLGGRVRSRDIGYGDYWGWTLSGRFEVADLLRNIYPYLIVKKHQAGVAYKILQLPKCDPRAEILANQLSELNRKRTKRQDVKID
jgi:intein/homing endonuclease